MTLEKLNKGDEFQDSNLITKSLYMNGDKPKITFNIIGDHVYTITNNIDTLVVAHDDGNGHGCVISTTHYNKG